ncbi:MAG: folylpolyglutamate synthase/dihydrofolate synthase family protein [Opitutales bacterium]
MNNFKDTCDFIYNLRNRGSSFSVDRMAIFAEGLGSPELAYPKIHIAGTNGKGSVCAMVEIMLRKNSLKTGLFTSPHLIELGERIRVNFEILAKDRICEYVELLKGLAEEISKESPELAPSFFEYITLLAMQHFKEERVDVAIFEVGLGGRLDATNIIKPNLCIISTIDFDHTEYLGNTIEEIAREKAGIIKENVPVLCGNIPERAMQVIEGIAKEKNATIYKLSDFYKDKNEYPNTSLFGAFQRENAALALSAVKLFAKETKLDVNLELAKSALMEVEWACRWQEMDLGQGRKLIIDSSHNTQGARVLEENLSTLSQEPVIAVSVLGEERANALLKVIGKYAKKIILLRAEQDRALSTSRLRELLGNVKAEVVESSVDKFFDKANLDRLPSDELVISTGSIYLAGEVLSKIKGLAKPSLSDKI